MGIYELLNSAVGWTECRISGVLPEAFLNRCAARGLALISALPETDGVLLVRLRTRDLKYARKAARAAACTLETLSSGGGAELLRHLRKRAFAAAGLLLVFGLLAWSKLFIWEIDVTGCETLSPGQVLDALRECGVDYGSFWPVFTSDNLRSELLTELPELAWATVNIYGSRAEVIVRERVPKPEIWRETDPVDVAAEKTGFVTDVRTLFGTPLVHPGSAVTAGEPLISAQMDSAWGGTRLVHARGEVRAETRYVLKAAVPTVRAEKRYTGRCFSHWALVVGKKRLNFYQNSSISPDGCDRITDTWNFGAGKLFSFPVRLVRETFRAYETETVSRDLRPAFRELEALLDACLRKELGEGGEVSDLRYSAEISGGMLTVTLQARCAEDIGREIPRSQAAG